MEPLEHPEDQFVRDVSMPLEPEEHAIQLELLRSFFGAEQKNIWIWVGGTTAGSLREPGIEWWAWITRRALALAAQACGTQDDLVHQDLREDQPLLHGPFDAVLLLGNTLMELVSPDEVVAVASNQSLFVSASVLIIEDIPGLYWPLLSSGQWGDGEADGFEWSGRIVT